MLVILVQERKLHTFAVTHPPSISSLPRSQNSWATSLDIPARCRVRKSSGATLDLSTLSRPPLTPFSKPAISTIVHAGLSGFFRGSKRSRKTAYIIRTRNAIAQDGFDKQQPLCFPVSNPLVVHGQALTDTLDHLLA